MNYKNIVRDLNPRKNTGGYKNVVLFAPQKDFLSMSMPPDPAPLHGDSVTITAAHTFTDPKGFLTMDCKTHSVTGTAASVGDPGAMELQYTYVFTLIGDSASTQESMQRLLNDHIIWLLKEANCLADDSYVQLGDECFAPENSVAADFKNTKEGMKEWTITVVTKARYFYTATVTMSTETEEEEG